MINLRYHIISITAVFLALGIGLTLGSSFLDRVTVDNLKQQLDTVQGRVDATESQNKGLDARLGAMEERDSTLAAQLPERILRGRLSSVPVLVIATRGTDESVVTGVTGALSGADARVMGTWWLTDRWLLDDTGKADQLAGILDLSTRDVDRLRRIAAIRLAELLAGASAPPPVPVDPATPVSALPDQEPLLIAALRDAGFIEYQAVSGARDDRVLQPGSGARYVVVSNALTKTGPSVMATALLTEMVANGTAPIVAAQGEADLRGPKGDASDEARHATFVGPLRSGDLTRQRLSTIDDLDSAAGLTALVLAVEDLGGGHIGHYGTTSSAARLLPAEPGG